MSTGISQAKQRLRAEIRSTRTVRQPNDPGFLEHLTPLLTHAKVIAGYLAYGDEPVITGALLRAIDEGKRVLLPILRSDNDLDWGDWAGEPLASTGNLFHPATGTLAAIAEADVIIVPALAIDRFGHRLGQGGGSYDRALVRNSNASVIGVIFDEEFLESVPYETHDLRVNLVVTPSQVVHL